MHKKKKKDADSAIFGEFREAPIFISGGELCQVVVPLRGTDLATWSSGTERCTYLATGAVFLNGFKCGSWMMKLILLCVNILYDRG